MENGTGHMLIMLWQWMLDLSRLAKGCLSMFQRRAYSRQWVKFRPDLKAGWSLLASPAVMLAYSEAEFDPDNAAVLCFTTVSGTTYNIHLWWWFIFLNSFTHSQTRKKGKFLVAPAVYSCERLQQLWVSSDYWRNLVIIPWVFILSPLFYIF